MMIRCPIFNEDDGPGIVGEQLLQKDQIGVPVVPPLTFHVLEIAAFQFNRPEVLQTSAFPTRFHDGFLPGFE